MGRWGLLGVDVGPRPQEPAAALVAQGVARVREVPSFLPDGWNASRAALLQVVGVVDRRRRRGTVGRTPTPRLVAPNNLGDAQVVKVRNQAGQVGAGRRRVVCGGPRRCGPPWRLRARGPTLQTAFMERWDGTLRGLVAPLRRRPRCLSWSRPRHRGRRWLMVSLSNCVRPHKSLRQGRTPRTPAMAIGLTEHVWSSREYSWLQVHTAPVLTQHMDAQMARLLPPALQDQPRGRPQPPPPVEATAGHKKATAPLPKAARGARYCSPGLPKFQCGLYRVAVKFGMGCQNPVHLSPFSEFFQDLCNRDMSSSNNGFASRTGGNKTIMHSV